MFQFNFNVKESQQIRLKYLDDLAQNSIQWDGHYIFIFTFKYFYLILRINKHKDIFHFRNTFVNKLVERTWQVFKIAICEIYLSNLV